ncbi:hypothetical protein Tco_0609285 [Tanacetum coccineum]
MSVEESDESDGEPTNRPTERRRPSGVAFRDTSNVSKKKSLDQNSKEEKDVDKEPIMDEQAIEDQADDDIVRTLVTMLQKEKPKVPPSSSIRSLSSNYDTEIKSLLDIPIQQEIPSALSAPLLDVLVLVILPPTTTTPTPTPLQA